MAGLPFARSGPESVGDEGAGRRRARARIDSSVEPTRTLDAARGRRLSPAERRALRERVEARSVRPEAVAPPRPPQRPVPTMPRVEPEGTVRSRGMVVLGTLLIVGLTVLAFAGGRLFGSATRSPPSPPPPTARAQAAVVPATPAAVRLDVAASPVPTAAGVPMPVVCLDPGHGGPDRGFSRGPSAGLPPMDEATLVLEHAWDLAARLRQRGFRVVLTRETDNAVNAATVDVNGDGKTARDDAPGSSRFATLDELQARIDICNAAAADLLVSMHVNGYSTPKPRGYETWFTRERPFGDRNAAFATLAYSHLGEQLRAIGYVPPEEERGVNPDTAADVQMEYAQFRHFIITGPAVPGAVDPSRMPGAIVEVLFVSNDQDAAVLASPEGRNAIVTAYENAIVEYFEWFPVGDV